MNSRRLAALKDSANPNYEIVRTHLINPDARNPDDPTPDYFSLLALIGG